MRLIGALAVAGWAATASLGCRPEQDDTAAPTVRTYTFSGTVKPSFAGRWLSPFSTLDLRKDGNATITAVIASPKGRSSADVQGQWRVDGTNLMLRYPSKGGAPVVLKYATELKGDTMNAVQAGTGIKTLYKRKKKTS